MYHNEYDMSMTTAQTSVFTAPWVYFLNSCTTPPKHRFVDSIPDSAGMKKVRIQPAGRQKREGSRKQEKPQHVKDFFSL